MSSLRRLGQRHGLAVDVLGPAVIFLKLNLAYAEDVSKRVMATLLFLANAESVPPA